MTDDVEITIFPDMNDLFYFAADDFSHRAIAAVNATGEFSVVLAGGNTPKLFFDTLTRIAQYKKNIPWAKIQFFFGDERYVPANNSESNYYQAYEHLFSKLPINPNNIFRIPTECNDPNMAANEYDKILRTRHKSNAYPMFDLVYLGLGENAHTASIMPLSDIAKHYAENSPADKNNQLVASLYVPTLKMYRITLTPLALNNAKTIIFMVTGRNKATAVKEVLNGKTDPLHYPAQLIQSVHGKTIWYLDDLAAEKLTVGITK